MIDADLARTVIAASLALLDEDEKGVHTMDTPGGKQEMAVISEAGLYSLILRSRKPEAKAFKRWITHEVIPSIRKTGSYGTGQKTALPFAISTPLADRLAAAMTVFSAAGLQKNQLALAADKFFKHETGVSALGICGGAGCQAVSPRSLTGSGALRYQVGVRPHLQRSVEGGFTHSRKPQLTRRQYHVTVECQAF